MKRSYLIFVLTLLNLFRPAHAQTSGFDMTLSFEGRQIGKTPRDWGGSNDGTVFYDNKVVHSGKGAARLERNAQSPSEFSTLTQALPINFGGQTIELRGFLRTEGVEDSAGLWLRQDGESGTLEFDNMQDRGVRGTTGWTEYTIELPLNAEADDPYFGVLISGKGKVWADDLELLVDGKSLSEAPERVIKTTVLDTDKEFDEGSGITATSLTEIQTENLAVLGKVWGFLKYHHPRVAKGELHWDYELFRVLPSVLEAESPAARNRVLSRWVDRLGVPASCDPYATLPEDIQLRPPLAWLEDTEQLGPILSRQLQTIYQNRFTGEEQFYVSLEANVSNPIFDHELSYADRPLPDPGFRMLSLFRYWNIIAYWFPYRNQIDGSWDAVLREFLPRMVAAATLDAYRLELLALVTRIQDTHANLWSDLEVRPPRGACRWPVALRFVEGRATVTSLFGEKQGGGLEVGDVVTRIGGQSVESLIEAWRPYYSASNETRKLADIAQNLPRGNCGEGDVMVSRQGETQTLTPERLSSLDETPPSHDRPGETFQLLSPDVAYLKLSSARIADVNSYLSQATGTQGFIIDIRNYPSEFVVFALGSHLIQNPTPFARFTLGDLANPGTFTWTEPITLTPSNTLYKGKIVILVDESSISQAEYTALAFRAAPNAVVIGSTTAGADGNVSSIPLPSGVDTLISGIGVFYPDKRPTQQVGIVPDIIAAPTLKGIREGRDEVLERALRYVLGSKVSDREIRQFAK